MKKISVLLGSALCMLAAGCTKDATDTVVPNERTLITASIEETRTVLGDRDDASGKYDVYWCSGDRIVVNGVASEALADVDDKAVTASFVVGAVLAAPYEAVYPASVYDAGKVVLPAVQSYTEGSFANGTAVLVGTGDNTGVAMRNACGFVKVTVLPSETSGCPVDYVKFYGNSGEAVCGAFDIDYAAALLTAPAEVAESAASVTVKAEGGVEISAEGVSYCISVPAQTFAEGFTVEIVDVKGHRMTQKSTKLQSVSAGNILAMPAVQFVPTETIIDTEIRTAADMVALAETVKGGNLKGNYLLANDIDMASVADWEGIGTGDLLNGFNGTFDGRGFAIKNLKSAYPIFNFALANSVIKNVVIDASCEFVNAEANTDKMNVASLVGMGRGVVEGCVNNASVTHSGTGSADVYVGGLVGRIYRTGRISDCTNNGTVASTGKSEGKVISVGGVLGTFDRTADTDTAEFRDNVNTGSVTNGADCKTLSVGGVAGRSAHITCTIADCVNRGAVLSNSTAVNAEQTNRANYVGGISGQNTGSLSGCTNYGTVTSSSLYYETRMGGVAGTVFSNSTIEQCTNETSGVVAALCARTESDGKVIVNQEHCGGVVGQCEGHIINCTNKAAVNSSSAPLTVNVGGVCGYVRNSTTLSYNVNEGAVTVNGGGRVVNVGGLYASFGKAETVNDGVSTNKGAVTVSGMESITSAYLRCGGIVGFAYPETKISETENAGNITVTLQPAFNYYAVGGVIGSAECGASDVANSGKIIINNANPVTNRNAKLYVGGITGWNAKGEGHVWDNCRNNGEIGMASGNADAKILFSGFMGGIVGYSALSLEIKNCTQTKYLNWSAPNVAQDGYFTASGGIIGAIDGASAKIENCHVTANLRHYMYNRTVNFSDYRKMCHGGGIVGCAAGADAANRVAIVGCSNTGFVENKRSSAAGIVGYAQYCTVSDCRFTGTVTGSGPHFSSGIAGVMKDTSVTGSTVKSSGIYSHSASTVDDVSCLVSAGIAGYMYGESSVSECKVFATLIQNAASNSTAEQHNGMGMIAGVAMDDAVIADCGVGGTLNTGSTGNPANLLVTLSASDFENSVCGYGSAAVSGTYYWDGTEE